MCQVSLLYICVFIIICLDISCPGCRQSDKDVRGEIPTCCHNELKVLAIVYLLFFYLLLREKQFQLIKDITNYGCTPSSKLLRC